MGLRYLAWFHIPTAIFTTLSTRLSELASRRPYCTVPQGHYKEWGGSKGKRTGSQARILLVLCEKVRPGRRPLTAPEVVDWGFDSRLQAGRVLRPQQAGGRPPFL